jgi:hypothetical protein
MLGQGQWVPWAQHDRERGEPDASAQLEGVIVGCGEKRRGSERRLTRRGTGW